MSTVQRQDLTIFNDQTVLSRALLSGTSHDMMLVSSTMSTQPVWLLNALAESFLFGKTTSINSSSDNSRHSHENSSRHVVIGSFINDSKFYTNSLQRLKIHSTLYTVVDLMTDFVVKNHDKPRSKLLGLLVERFTSPEMNSMIIIDQPEILLSLIEGLTCDELFKYFISPLSKRCNIFVVSTSTEQFQDHDFEPESTEFVRFITKCLYKSIVQLSLNPLETGRAKDVTGSLRIARGGQLTNHLSVHVVENEYLYLNERESIKLFYR
ncbi:hypothetical protein KAFR_0I02700 [Kazachstania africana CBS 2517]|uniref:Elongator complex protein 6 n=1 Tax=Kazachstania africana (strain ATCC 22294 / BCRC 22015 / CBS 2517 / CECT 1963 / NBRC 1671 / NRRL Y-8276) TaxID=1071382 RepID=H2B099_KAZAF|nr:hypothetical protein KAFR_0I02700 [Kazachstania africana CBS 2517]CCF60049.1 hypothetical protein KAFR_0I02700 [Kazachstania africana CBS 2517]